ncbi:MAG: LysM peptidoglycan-binding domain-containing protein [Clostridia bacterium]|nr:LysM peptidoglycan-binding domain-containing protein [Clostridia bacterium]
MSKKYRIKAPVRFTAIVTTLVLICVFAVSALTGYSDVSAAQEPEYINVRVQAGDTLWNLAKTYGPDDQDVRQTVRDICSLNNISAADLQAGQYITIQTSL